MTYEIISKPHIPSAAIRARVPLACGGHTFVTGRREMLLTLSAAVSRSRAVLLLWDLADEEQDISRLLSKAVGLPLINAGNCGADGSACFYLPKGAVAFTDADSAVYGYSLESGRQSIIVLTDLPEAQDFAVRAFVLPYLAERYPEAFPASPEPGEAQPLLETPEPADTPDGGDAWQPWSPPVVSMAPEPGEAPEAETAPEPGVAAPEQAPARPGGEPPAHEIPAPLPPDGTLIWGEDGGEDLPAPDESPRPAGEKARVPLALKILTILLSAALILSGGLLLYDKYFAGKLADKHYTDLRALKGRTADGALPPGALSGFGALYEENPRVGGWISLSGTGIDYPVLIPPEDKPAYYENRLPDGLRNKYGAPYLPAGYDPIDYYQNTVVKAANFSDGRMFSDFERYFDRDFFRSHPDIVFDTLYSRNQWLVFAVLITEKTPGGEFDPGRGYFTDDAEYLRFIDEIKKRAVLESDLEVNENDMLLTVVTDYPKLGGVRMAVVARKLRFGESAPQNASVRVNGEAVFPDVWKLKNGSFTLPESVQKALAEKAVPAFKEQEPASLWGGLASSESVGSASRPQEASSVAASSAAVSSKAASSKAASSKAGSSRASGASSKASSKAASSAASSKAGSSASAQPPGDLGTLTVINQSDKNKLVTGPAADILAQVVEAEMGSGFEPEALKAQAVAAYTFILNQSSPPGVPMKTAKPRAVEAANAVAGEVVLYGSQRAQVFYFAMSAGKTAFSQEVWSTAHPYLISVDSSVDKNVPGFQSRNSYSKNALKEWVQADYGVDLGSKPPQDWFRVTYDSTGLYANTVQIGGQKSIRGNAFRLDLNRYVAGHKLSGGALRSHAIQDITYIADTEELRFTVLGYGHGVGMSQQGANRYAADKGWNYKQILSHYFPGTAVGRQ